MATRHIVSVKAVVFTEAGVILLKNERDQWELPGGQLEASEDPHDCIVREVREELNIEVQTTRLLSTWQFQPIPDHHVLIIAYECALLVPSTDLRISHEHKDVRIFATNELSSIPIPEGYVRAIRQAQGDPN